MKKQIDINPLYSAIVAQAQVSDLSFGYHQGIKDAQAVAKSRGITEEQQIAQLAIAMTDWADNVQSCLVDCLPITGPLVSLESIKNRRATKKEVVKAEVPYNEVITQYLVEHHIDRLYTQAYWFAKANLEGSSFESVIGTHDAVLDLVHKNLATKYAVTDYPGTNLQQATDWYEKMSNRQDLLINVIGAIETHPSLDAVHALTVESHKQLIEDAQERRANEALNKMGAYFQQPLVSGATEAFDSPMPAVFQ